MRMCLLHLPPKKRHLKKKKRRLLHNNKTPIRRSQLQMLSPDLHSVELWQIEAAGEVGVHPLLPTGSPRHSLQLKSVLLHLLPDLRYKRRQRFRLLVRWLRLTASKMLQAFLKLMMLRMRPSSLPRDPKRRILNLTFQQAA